MSNLVPIRKIVEWAQQLQGKPYVMGAENDGKPVSKIKAEDCSELVQNACEANGVHMVDGAMYQIRFCKQHGTLVEVDEAIETYGALLFSFSEDPFECGDERPSHAHVAFSLGNGYTFEARGKAWGVGSWSAYDRFNYAARIPGVKYEEA